MAKQKSMAQDVGKGGILGKLGRIAVFILTAGFAYPNVFIEGMNLTSIQGESEGTLYDNPKDKK
jgi:hypothetical protein